jgi:L-alanine-DL-glutamate epimerase-like enolase superfamily enzyme
VTHEDRRLPRFCDRFVVKLMKTGGIRGAVKGNAIAEAAGIGVMVANLGESPIATSAHFHVNIALADAVHGDVDLPRRQGALEHGLGRAIKQEVVDDLSWIDVPDGPWLGIGLIEETVDLQRVARRW